MFFPHHFIIHFLFFLQFPLVTVDVPCLQFGLIQLGQSVSRSLSLTNHCSSSLHYQLNQIVILSDNHDNDDTPLLPFVVST